MCRHASERAVPLLSQSKILNRNRRQCKDKVGQNLHDRKKSKHGWNEEAKQKHKLIQNPVNGSKQGSKSQITRLVFKVEKKKSSLFRTEECKQTLGITQHFTALLHLRRLPVCGPSVLCQRPKKRRQEDDSGHVICTQQSRMPGGTGGELSQGQCLDCSPHVAYLIKDEGIRSRSRWKATVGFGPLF